MVHTAMTGGRGSKLHGSGRIDSIMEEGDLHDGIIPADLIQAWENVGPLHLLLKPPALSFHGSYTPGESVGDICPRGLGLVPDFSWECHGEMTQAVLGS